MRSVNTQKSRCKVQFTDFNDGLLSGEEENDSQETERGGGGGGMVLEVGDDDSFNDDDEFNENNSNSMNASFCTSTPENNNQNRRVSFQDRQGVDNHVQPPQFFHVCTVPGQSSYISGNLMCSTCATVLGMCIASGLIPDPGICSSEHLSSDLIP